jgi:glycosyltransferase involved in cell wall biosynthesis
MIATPPADMLPDEGIPATIAGEPLKGRHILIVVENLPLPFDRRVWQEARTLKAAGADISIICPTGKGHEARHEVIEGIAIHRHPLPLEAKGITGFFFEYGAALFWELVLAWRIFLRHRFDVIQGCNPPDLIFLVALPFKLLGVRYIFDHHDINPELFDAKFGKRGLLWRLTLLLEKLSFRAADVSIATNQSYRKIAIERGGMPPERVHVVRSGPDLSKLKLVRPAPHWKNGRANMVGYVGVMGAQEGIDLLIDAVGHLVHKMGRDDVQFVLVGGGPALEDLKTMTTERGLADYITFTGRIPDDVLFQVLSTMDIGVNPDRVNEMNDKSTMNKVMEYMSLGKAIVQFDVTEGRFSAQEASLYARPNDPIDLAEKIATLVDDPARREEMGEFGRARVIDELNWQHQIKPLIAAYRQALSA